MRLISWEARGGGTSRFTHNEHKYRHGLKPGNIFEFQVRSIHTLISTAALLPLRLAQHYSEPDRQEGRASKHYSN